MTVVREFHEKFGLEVNDFPRAVSNDTIRLRIRLIAEEYDEAMKELRALLSDRLTPEERFDVYVELLKELADLRYVVDGTAVSLGLPIDEAFEEVHRSNMTKVWEDGTVRKDAGGKVIKPPTYSAADFSSILRRAAATIDSTAEEE